MQTAVIANVIDAAPDGPKVLMGDFNARPTAAEMIPIFSRFVDAWTPDTATAGNPNGFTSPARLTGNPTSRIDYIFVSDDITVTSVYVPIDAHTRLAADHYPVVADITLPGSEVGLNRRTPVLPDGAGEGPGEDILEPDEAGAPPCCGADDRRP